MENSKDAIISAKPHHDRIEMINSKGMINLGKLLINYEKKQVRIKLV